MRKKIRNKGIPGKRAETETGRPSERAPDRQTEKEHQESRSASVNDNRIKPHYTFSSDIPDMYNETYICALPRNPDWLYVYWEISPATIQQLKNRLGEHYTDPQSLLRLVQLEKSGDSIPSKSRHVSADIINIATDSESWYIKVPETGRKYIVEYGQLIDKEYIPICRTKPVDIPASSLNEPTNENIPDPAVDLMLISAGLIHKGTVKRKTAPASHDRTALIVKQLNQNRMNSGLIK